MEFTCTKEHLSIALKEVGGIAGRNPALPILRHILLRVERGQLSLAATDLEVGVTTHVTGKAEKDGAVTVPVKQLAEYITHLPSQNIHLRVDQHTLHISCGSAYASFQGEVVENFPLIPTVKEGNRINLPKHGISAALDRVLYAAALDETRPELAGIYVTSNASSLIFAATDSYRLAETHLPLEAPPKEPLQFILPLRSAQEIRRITEGEDRVALTATSDQILIQTPLTHLVSRLLEGKYPDYTQVIPGKPTTTAALLRHDLLHALRGASVFSYGEANTVLLEVLPKALRVTATAQEMGETVNEVPADISGESVIIHFNPRYLIDALNALPGERIVIGLTNPSVPIVMRPQGVYDETLALVMPIKT